MNNPGVLVRNDGRVWLKESGGVCWMDLLAMPQ